MTLLDLCEPFFQYMCRLNRSARKGGRFEPDQVRSEIKSILDDMRTRAAATPGMAEQFEKIEVVLVFFADFLIKESDLPFAMQWEELAHEYDEHAGDEKFFDMLDATLNDRSQQAGERLAVYYTCIGLGFTGFYTGQPEYLRKKMLEIASRIRHQMETDEAALICPEAYEHVNTADLIEPPGTKLVGIGIALIGLVLVLFTANVVLFNQKTRQLNQALDTISSHAPAEAAPVADISGDEEAAQ